MEQPRREGVGDVHAPALPAAAGARRLLLHGRSCPSRVDRGRVQPESTTGNTLIPDQHPLHGWLIDVDKGHYVVIRHKYSAVIRGTHI